MAKIYRETAKVRTKITVRYPPRSKCSIVLWIIFHKDKNNLTKGNQIFSIWTFWVNKLKKNLSTIWICLYDLALILLVKKGSFGLWLFTINLNLLCSYVSQICIIMEEWEQCSHGMLFCVDVCYFEEVENRQKWGKLNTPPLVP